MAYAESGPAMANVFARGFNNKYYQPLHVAILKGDWESAKAFLDRDPSAWTAKITVLGRTALHVAAVGGQWQLVEKLVQHVPAESLAELDFMGCTCLHYVAMGESIKAAKALVVKNPSLTQITDFKGFTPLIYSITSTGCKKMAWYLALNTTDERPSCPFSGSSASHLVALLTAAGFHDITMYLIHRHPNLATISDSNGSIILNVLSKRPSDFQSGNKLGLLEKIMYQIGKKLGVLEKFIYNSVPVELDQVSRQVLGDSHGQSSPHQSCFGQYLNTIRNHVLSVNIITDAMLSQVFSVRLVEYVCSRALAMNDTQFWQSFVSADIIFNSASYGIVEILTICFQFFPDLVWTHVPNEGYVAQIAIKYRQAKVFNLMRKMPIVCKILVLAMNMNESKNTTSHLAARYAFPQLPSISGGAFRLQEELEWFKAVEELDHPLHKEVKNQDGKTAWQLFREEHKDCRAEGEKWMKDTSNSCMVVATLIATVVFAAVLTVPGGNTQDKGTPILLSDKTFLLFAVSDALALFFSLASLLMFVEILTSRYPEEDFLETLPKRLIRGMFLLSYAIFTTMIAFGAALTLVLRDMLNWVSIPITFLACVPVFLFVNLLGRLFKGAYLSTYEYAIYHL